MKRLNWPSFTCTMNSDYSLVPSSMNLFYPKKKVNVSFEYFLNFTDLESSSPDSKMAREWKKKIIGPLHLTLPFTEFVAQFKI